MRVLYHYPLCPFSRKIRLAMYEKKLDFSSEIEPFWDANPKLLKMNSAGTVPVLIDINGTIIADDTTIIEYLEEAFPSINLLGNDLNQKIETRRLISWFDKKFYLEVSYHLLLEKVIRRFKKGESGPNSQSLRSAKDSIAYHLEYIGWLTDRRNWLSGENFSLSDITAAAHLSMADYFGDVPWDKHPQAKSWYVRVKSRPSFRNFFTDRIPGFSPSSHYSELDF